MFKSLSYYKTYKKLIKQHSNELLNMFNIRIDNVNRLYTVINLPPQTDTYGPKDGPRMTAAMLKGWLAKLDNYLLKTGLKEFTKVESMEEIDESNYLLIVRFKFFDTAKVATNLTYAAIGTGAVVLGATILALVLKLLM